MTPNYLPFELADYDRAYALWTSTDGTALSSADSRESIAAFLARNPGLSQVSVLDARLVGTILVGHDGRRGYIHHLAVAPQARRQGIASKLVAHALASLARCGIQKCHVLVYAENKSGIAFWQAARARVRDELVIMSLPTA